MAELNFAIRRRQLCHLLVSCFLLHAVCCFSVVRQSVASPVDGAAGHPTSSSSTPSLRPVDQLDDEHKSFLSFLVDGDDERSTISSASAVAAAAAYNDDVERDPTDLSADADATRRRERVDRTGRRLRRATGSGRWAKTNLQVWGKRDPDAAGSSTRNSNKDWARNNFKIWGKRGGDYSSENEATSRRRQLLRVLLSTEPSPRRQQLINLLIRAERMQDADDDVDDEDVVGERGLVLPRRQYPPENLFRSSLKREASNKDVDEVAGVPDWGKKGWASNNVRIWG
jgi:hypothetical protein